MQKKLSLITVVSVSIFLLFWGCGIKGPPLPPRREKPPAVQDLSYRLDGNGMELSWSVPEKNNSRQPDLTGFTVYVSKIPLSESECENCPLKFKAIADVPIREKAEHKPLIHSETLDSGYQYVYMVRGYSKDDMSSEDSNYINFNVE